MTPASEPELSAIEAFSLWLQDRERGTAPSFEELLAQRPALAPELFELHAAWTALAGAEHPTEAPAATGTRGSEGELAARANVRPAASGRYRIEEEVARGGMGAILRVYDHDLGRHLAMKVALDRGGEPRPASSPRRRTDALGRFLEEAHVTGRLEHPGIVPVHELGLDEAGRVYFTMKLVQGRDLKAIFELVRRREEGWSEVRALGVLLKVCEAIRYAHAQGVIHRDLKPANVMVGSFGEVYVMDWGLAKVLENPAEADLRPRAGTMVAGVAGAAGGGEGIAADDTDAPLRTGDGDVLGTPAYMPPEQARGEIEAMGPHSDVYAVGAMLYHLLAGHAPYVRDGAQVNHLRVWRSVVEGPPEAIEREAPRAPPELVAICERAMEREIAARYRDAGALAADLSAYLEGRVVAAYEQGTWAETRKWVRRNRALAGSLAAAVMLLAAGLVSSLLFTRELAGANATIERRGRELQRAAEVAEESARVAEARRQEAETMRAEALAQREAAVQSAEETKLVADFQSRMLTELSIDEFGRKLVVELVRELGHGLERAGAVPEEIEEARTTLAELLQPANPTNVAQAVLAEELFEPALRVIDEEYAGKPVLAAALQTPLADTLVGLSLLAQAEPPARAALAARRAGLGDEHPDTLSSMHSLAGVLWRRGELAEAELLYREALAGRRAVLGERDPATLRTLNALALVSVDQEQPARAEAELSEALDGMRAVLGSEHATTLTAINNLGTVFSRQGRFAEAEAAFEESLAGQRILLGDRHRDTLRSIGNLATARFKLGRLSEAEALYREAWEGCRPLLGDEHPATLHAMHGLARVFSLRGDVEAAEEIYRRELEVHSVRLGDHHPSTLTAIDNLANVLLRQDRHEEAELLSREVLARRRATLGERHPDTLSSIHTLAAHLHAVERSAEAEPLLREVIAGRREALGEQHPTTCATLHDLGVVLANRGDLAGAALAYKEAFEGRRARLGDDHPDTRTSWKSLIALYRKRHGLEPDAGHDREVEELERMFAK